MSRCVAAVADICESTAEVGARLRPKYFRKVCCNTLRFPDLLASIFAADVSEFSKKTTWKRTVKGSDANVTHKRMARGESSSVMRSKSVHTQLQVLIDVL